VRQLDSVLELADGGRGEADSHSTVVRRPVVYIYIAINRTLRATEGHHID
jgi:hypothetical protein